MEGLIIFLTERTKAAGVSTLPEDICRKVASTYAPMVNAARYKTKKASKGVRSETGPVRI